MKKQRKSATIIILVVLLLFFIFYYLGFIKTLEQGLFRFFAPIEKLLYNWSLTFKKINQLGEILEENDYLKSELSKLSVDYVKLLNLEAENEYLRKELDYLKEDEFNYQLADVISKQLYNEQILFINKGSKQGIAEGLAVTVGQGIIIGKIISVSKERSEVQLLTDPESGLAVSLNHETGTNGIVKGKAGSSLVMEFIPQNLAVKDDDLVITSGLEENIPRGLLVGKVTGIESLVGQIFQKANILPPFNYQNFQTLTIILPQTR